MKRMLKYLRPLSVRITFGLTVKILGTLAELLLPLILSHILENVIVLENIGTIVFYGVLMVLCAAAACVCNIVANRSAARVTMIFARSMRKDLFERTLYLSARDADRFTVPSLESRITTDTYNVQNFIGMMQRMGVRAPILLLGGVTITLIMDPALSLVMIATLPLIFITTFLISRKGVPLYTGVQRSVDGMVRVVREDVQGIRVIKALSKNDYENRRYDKVNSGLSRAERKAGTIMGSVNPIMTLLMNLGITAVVALAAIRVSEGKSDAPTIIAFMQYFTLISMSVMSLSRMFVSYTKCAASANRISEVLETPDDYFVTEKCEKCDTGDHISFENVCFSYLGRKNNIDNLSFSLKKGDSLGIIGATGSGKSTLIKLLIRFYENDSGKITISGNPVTSYTRSELTQMFGVALQNDFVYAETVAENIRFGRDIPMEDVIRAAKIAQAHDFIDTFPEKYDHMLTPKGTNLSGGQRQRLLIARAVAARPDILILDDSSSALDYKTDASLRAALANELGDTTLITIAQRVSSVKNCTHIIVLDNGRVIGQGTHEHLIENCREYREISDSQMGGAFVE